MVFCSIIDQNNNSDKAVPEKKTANSKSSAKALGLKSSFVVNNDIYMTSFGRGNAAVLEKKISNDTVENIEKNINIVEIKNTGFTIESRRISGKNAFSNDPKYHKNIELNGNFLEDNLGARAKLENKVFGKNFNDNIHIQLIYNILDIEKIMAQYVQDIVYLLHNVIKEDCDDRFMGYLSIRNTYNVFRQPEKTLSGDALNNVIEQKQIFEKMLKSGRLAYFGNAFLVPSGGKGSDKLRDRKEIYHIMAFMGSLRQSYFHGVTRERASQGPTWAYTLESKLKGDKAEYRDTLDKIFDEGYSRVSKDFGDTNKVNLQILEELLKMRYGEVSHKDIAERYYDFVQLKKHKYLGFSIKKLRECLIQSTDASCYLEDCYNSVRHKLYQIIDFLIYDRYSFRDITAGENMVCRLRASMNDKAKEEIYAHEAEQVWDALGGILLDELKKRLTEDSIKDHQKRYKKAEANSLWDVTACQHKGEVNCFCKLVYMMTLLLDGKEINDLLTTLVNKFDNIASFIDVMEELGIEHRFKNGYEMFKDSKKICADLQMINSFARKQVPLRSAKERLYRDALVILGLKMSESDIRQFMLDNDIISESSDKGAKTQKKHDFRNFIVSNVIESDRFKYIVKYSSADGSIALKENKKLISFVLRSLPDTMIDRYCSSCKLDEANASTEQKITALIELITKLNFKSFMNVKTSNRSTDEDKENKAKYQAIISLYLMVLYKIVKNMIYVNSRYVVAFHCLERDHDLHDEAIDKNQYSALTKKFIANKYLREDAHGYNKRAGNYLSKNINCCTEKTRRSYRNQVDHFAVVRMIGKYAADICVFDSWFELYHYVMQRILFDEARDLTEKESEYKALVAKHKTYCKDMVKALNTPFGYDLPRYKNLSIKDLFDRNDYLPGTGESPECT